MLAGFLIEGEESGSSSILHGGGAASGSETVNLTQMHKGSISDRNLITVAHVECVNPT